PVRNPKEISSTDEEHEAALYRVRQIRSFLQEQGFPDCVLADSGNGGHGVYRICLPNDDASKALVEDFLKAIAGRFSDDRVKIDTSVFNAGRISKVYGTMACKGDEIPGRPHRQAKILEAPSSLAPVPRSLLENLVGNQASTVLVANEITPS